MKFPTVLAASLELLVAFYCMKLSESSTIKDKISGTVIKVLDKNVEEYLGIPYAAPPIGDLRFREPQPINDWNSIYNATRKPPACMQNHVFADMEWKNRGPKELSEDCLYLNIWVPASKTSDDFLTTMVWIHGGGFRTGSSNMDVYDGAALASLGDVIVVSFNYRLGIFGFANFDRDDEAMNIGMLDQVMALKWVHDNIEAFGGNKDSITIFGVSSGSISGANHLISPMSKGLFKRAILQSGSNYLPLFTAKPEDNIELTSMLTKELGCSGIDVMTCIRNINSKEILAVEEKLLQMRGSHLSFFPQKGSPFLPEDPFHSVDVRKFHDVDIMIGQTKDEGFVYFTLQKFELITEEDPILSESEAASVLSKTYRLMGEPLSRIVKEYLENITDEDSSSIVKETIKALGDGLFTCPIFHLAEKVSKNNQKVFHYVFNHTRIRSGLKKWMGVPHFEDIHFVFGMPFVKTEDYTTEEKKFSKKIIELWTSFAKTGKPSFEDMREEWLQFDEEERRSLSLTLGNIHLRRAEEEKCKFWAEFYGYN